MKGLIIKQYWMCKILGGEKSIEVRGCRHHFVGKRVLLLVKGGWCIGSATLGRCFEFNSVSWEERRSEHCLNWSYYKLTMKYKHPYGWKLLNVRRYKPYRYKHPRGATVWVKEVVKM